jgi:hypothetical protein
MAGLFALPDRLKRIGPHAITGVNRAVQGEICAIRLTGILRLEKYVDFCICEGRLNHEINRHLGNQAICNTERQSALWMHHVAGRVAGLG